jgi:hypothetical protein
LKKELQVKIIVVELTNANIKRRSAVERMRCKSFCQHILKGGVQWKE